MLSFISVPVCGYAFAYLLRRRGRGWSWALPWAGLALAPDPGGRIAGAAVLAALLGLQWHNADLAAGSDLAAAARRRTGPVATLLAALAGPGRLVEDEGLAIGRSADGRLVRVPAGSASGSHKLIVGATGAGKTVTEAWILGHSIELGHGAVIIDPKGDALLRRQAAAAAARAGRRFVEWTPGGPASFNPYAHGSDSEVVDKALAVESWSEPHYLRQAQRYLGFAVRALRQAGETATPARLVELMEPRALEVLARGLADEREAHRVWDYLDSLDGRQRAGISGSRDRLAVLAESEVGRWLGEGAPQIDLLRAVRDRDVVLFRLEADRLPLVAQMVAGAILQDLIAVSAAVQGEGVASVVAIDEFSAIAAASVARLFGRGRGAGFSLLLVTQELADLRAAGGALCEQVLGNVESVVVHRQSVPASSRLLSELCGTRGVWRYRERVQRTPLGRAGAVAGSRSRELEPVIEAERIRTLATGEAVVIALAGTGAPAVRLARVFAPQAGGER
ncbi:MAG: hypothetical protein NVSMB51_05950 [Solirubrobacteraceae bacterium]